MPKDWKAELIRLVSRPPLWDEPMSRYTSIGIGGPAECLIFPQTYSELQNILSLVKEESLPLFILGSGTNILIRDGGIKGIVLHLSALCSEYSYVQQRLFAGAAVSLPYLTKKAIEKELQGLEFATGIPGTLGGALYMNAGAHGSSVGELVLEVKVMDYEGNIKIFGRQELEFSYRHSCFQERDEIILSAVLELAPGDGKELRYLQQKNTQERLAKQPSLPSAGSVFRNPPGMAAGKLIDDLGAKGSRVGGAMVSRRHANFIVNAGNATAVDVLSLIELLQDKVRLEYNLELELEIKVIGEE